MKKRNTIGAGIFALGMLIGTALYLITDNEMWMVWIGPFSLVLGLMVASLLADDEEQTA